MSKKATQIVNTIKRTKKTSGTFIVYLCRFLIRALFFVAMGVVYIVDKSFLAKFVEPAGILDFFRHFGIHQIIWIVLMCGMVIHIVPRIPITMSGRKAQKPYYQEPDKSFSKDELYRFIQIMNLKSWQVMLAWLLLNSVFALLYLTEIIGNAELVLLTFFYFCSDLICMMLFCPFQTFIMKNRCCVNCRIFDWGHFMMYTPMLFIKSWFSWSLFFTACIVLIRWEFLYASHPERFWHGSNSTLRCENCKDKMCRIKSPLQERYRTIQSDISVYFQTKFKK